MVVKTLIMGDAISASTTATHFAEDVQFDLAGTIRFLPDDGDNGWIAEDSLRNLFIRIGNAEYALLTQFQNRASIREALARLSSRTPDHSWSVTRALAFCEWCVRMGVLQTEKTTDAERLQSHQQSTAAQHFLQRLNPLIVRIVFPVPTQWFGNLRPLANLLFGFLGYSLWTAVIVIGLSCFVGHYESAMLGIRGTLSANQWLSMLLIWSLLKIAHEAGHGLACINAGGTVRECGLTLIAGIPVAFVDVASSRRLGRWTRIRISLAGVQMELGVASLAFLYWVSYPNSGYRDFALQTALLGSIATILLNLNPLMRFDGYFVLSDALRIPNLATRSEEYLRHRVWSFFTGSPRRNGKSTTALIRTYAWAAWGWKVVLCLTLFAAATNLFHGFGVVLVFVGCCVMFLPKWLHILDSLRNHSVHSIQPKRLIVTCAAVCLVGVTVAWLPWPFARNLHGVIAFSEPTTLRAPADCQVLTINCHEGVVDEGTPIAKLDSPELRLRVAELEAELAKTQIQSRQSSSQEDLANLQQFQSKVSDLAAQLSVAREKMEQLEVFATRRGTLSIPEFETLPNNFLVEGEEFGFIDHASTKSAVVAIPADLRESLSVGDQVWVKAPDRPAIRATIERFSPRASQHLRFVALYANNGGPLSVQPANDSASGAEYELVAPAFEAVLNLPAESSPHYWVGERISASIRPFNQTCWQCFRKTVQSMLTE